jgi:hypothetical protein
MRPNLCMQNYHQWLTDEYGLKKLIEHIWNVIGVASTCSDMDELKNKMDLYKGGRDFNLSYNSLRLRSAVERDLGGPHCRGASEKYTDLGHC